MHRQSPVTDLLLVCLYRKLPLFSSQVEINAHCPWLVLVLPCVVHLKGTVIYQPHHVSFFDSVNITEHKTSPPATVAHMCLACMFIIVFKVINLFIQLIINLFILGIHFLTFLFSNGVLLHFYTYLTYNLI